MPNVTQGRSLSDIPKAVALETCDFPIVEEEVAGYKILRLPSEIRNIFDHQGANVVRINSLTVAKLIPDYGGRGSGEEFSLLPHQDHLDPSGDPRRFLVLTKHEDGMRGSSTLIMNPSVAELAVVLEEGWIRDDRHRADISAEREYDTRFLISEEQYNRCLDEKGGYEHVVATMVGTNRTWERELSIRLGILGYLIRGPQADEVMQDLLRWFKSRYVEERWEHGGVVIIDNQSVFHARIGGNNPPLQRNFCV